METEFSQSSPLSVLLPPCLWPEGPQERGVPTFLSPSTSSAQEAVGKGLVNEKWAGEGEEMEREGRTTSEGGLGAAKTVARGRDVRPGHRRHGLHGPRVLGAAAIRGCEDPSQVQRSRRQQSRGIGRITNYGLFP